MKGTAWAPPRSSAFRVQTGLAPEPMLQWRVYLHAVAVDPLVLGLLL